MKKILVLIFTILTLSCESKFDKSIKSLKSNIWILDKEQEFTSGNPIKIFEGAEKKIHIFTDSNIYVYDSNGNIENIFSYEKSNDKGSLKIKVENLLSHNNVEFTVIVNDFMLVLIGGETGNLKKIDFNVLSNEALKNKISQNN
mgnify:CR=1 FL=1